MQRLEARIDAKVSSIKGELLEIVEEDFQDRRAKVNQEFAAKMRAKAASGQAGAPAGNDMVLEESAQDLHAHGHLVGAEHRDVSSSERGQQVAQQNSAIGERV